MDKYAESVLKIVDELRTERLDYHSEYLPLADAIQRLVAYEDTGLKPEEIDQICRAAQTMMFESVSDFVRYAIANFEELQAYRALSTIEELAALVKARDEGRLVVLPCKKDDKLFILTSDSHTGIEETKCKRIVVVNRENEPCAKIIAPCMYDDWGGAAGGGEDDG